MNNDDWATPQPLFDSLDNEFHFTYDVCASKDNHKCVQYFSEENSCLIHKWGYSNFMNPPYSNPQPFIQKAWEESLSGIVVCIVKVDTSTKWWGIFWDYETHNPKPGCKIRFLPKRVKFVPTLEMRAASARSGKKLNGPTFPSAVIIMDRRRGATRNDVNHLV